MTDVIPPATLAALALNTQNSNAAASAEPSSGTGVALATTGATDASTPAAPPTHGYVHGYGHVDLSERVPSKYYELCVANLLVRLFPKS